MKILIFTIALILSAITINAQEKDNTDYYVGYQFVRTNVETQTRSFKFNRETDSHGVNASVTRYASTGNLGLTGELGANFDARGRNLYTYMGGLTLKGNRNGKVQPFVKGLLGGYTKQNEGILSNKTLSGFAYSVGAGLDVKINKKLSLRLIQADYLATRNNSQYDNNVRIGSGLIW